jgi:hypothetical protein
VRAWFFGALVAAPIVACSLTALDGFSGGQETRDAASEEAPSDAPSEGPPDGDPLRPTVTKLRLVDVTTKTSVAGFDPIAEGARLPFSTRPQMTIEAMTSPETVGSVTFIVDRDGGRIEVNRPYTISRSSSTSPYVPWTPSPGPHEIVVTARAVVSGSGPGDSLRVNVVVE